MVDLVRMVARLDGDTTGFRAAFSQAGQQLQQFASQARRTSQDARGAFGAIGNAWTSMAGVLATVGVTVGLQTMIADATNFERSLNAIRAVTRASVADMRTLSAVTRRAGADFRVGANAAAAAAYELTKSGQSIADLNRGALDAAIVLAQATGGEYADAATIAARATQVFRLETEDMGRVVQGAVGVINAGHFELEDYVLALQQGGAAARDAGLSLEDFNAMLALTQRALGSSGSDTGTAARTFLSRLVPQSREAQAAMESLGLEFYDAQGRFVGLEETAERLRTAFVGLSDEQRNYNLVTIFGVDAQRQAIALMAEGATGIRSVRDEMAQAGTAAEMAQARTEGFAGATMNLRSAFEELGIAIGESGIMDLMTALTNWAAGGIRQGLRRQSDFDRGVAAIGTNGGPADPLDMRVWREAREEFGRRAGIAGALDGRRYPEIEAIRNEILADRNRIRDMLDDPIDRRDVYPWQDVEGRTYGSTWLGQQAHREFYPQSGEGWTRPQGIYVHGQWIPQPDTGSGVSPEGSGWRPPRPNGDGSRSRWDQNAWLEDIDSYLQRRAEIEGDHSAWLDQLAAELQKTANEGFDLPLKVGVEMVPDEMDRLKAEAEEFAADTISSIRDAWITGDWDSLGERLQQSWRAMLWDALLGDQMDRFMADLTVGLTRMLEGVFVRAGSGASARGNSIVEGEHSWMRGLGGIWDVIFGGGNSGGGGFAGFFAKGGTIGPGQWGIAGEEGPEPIYGGTTGVRVYPASEHNSGGGIVQNIHVDARGADAGVEQRIRLAVEEAAAKGAEMGARAVFSKVRRSSTT